MQSVVKADSRLVPAVEFSLPVRFKEADGIVVASCVALDVVSQGRDRESARRAVTEAVALFLETAFEQGTLDEVLRDQGFTSLRPTNAAPHTGDEVITVPLELVANAQAARRKLQTAG